MEYVVENATPRGLLDHTERMMAESGYSVQARSEGSITFRDGSPWARVCRRSASA